MGADFLASREVTRYTEQPLYLLDIKKFRQPPLPKGRGLQKQAIVD